MKNFKALVFVLGIACLSLLFCQKPASAVAVLDDNNAIYTDNFSDNTGLVTRSGTGASQGKLQLLNSSNGTSTPLVLTGYAITNNVEPLLLAKWGMLTFNAATSATTSIKIQVMDERSILYPDSLLPGNSAGFTSSPIDLSALDPLFVASSSPATGWDQNNQIRFKITLSTTNGKYTPTFDNLNLTWIATQGDLSSSTLATSAWPISEIDGQGTAHTPYYPDSVYPALRWVKNMGDENLSRSLIGKNNILYNHTSNDNLLGTNTSTHQILRAINSLTGATIWEKKRTIFTIGNGSEHITLAENGTIYNVDALNDNFCAFDSADGSTKWCYSMRIGHGNRRTAIGNDGTLYLTYTEGETYLDVYAIRPNGTTKWIHRINKNPASATMEDWPQNIVFNSDGDLYVGTTEFDGSGYQNNNGNLYIISHVDGSVLHTVNTGDIGGIDGANIVIDKNDVAYVANGNFDFVTLGRILAINKDGTIKWIYNRNKTAGWNKLSLRSDGILLAQEALFERSYALNTVDGSVVWQASSSDEWTDFFEVNRPGNLFSNGLNGFYFSEQVSSQYDNLKYFDKDYNQKWKFSIPEADHGGLDKMHNLGDPVMDQNGNLFVNYISRYGTYSPYAITDNTAYLLSLVPWHLSLSSNLAASYYRGNTINITAKSSMPAINPFNNEANKVQAVVDGNTKIPLTYGATDSNGNTLWTGSYTIPQSSVIGNHNIVLEAAQSMITTDASTTFATYPSGTNNTGIRSTSTFALILPNSSSLPAGYNAQPGSTLSPTQANFSITINNGAQTTSNPIITLNLTASPDTKNIAISENQNFQFASLESFTPTKQFQLSSGNGLKTIYVKFYTQYGFSTPTYQASIILNEKTNTFPASGLTNQPTTVDSSLPNSTTPPASGGNSTANPGQSVSIPTPAGNITANLPAGFTFQHTLQSGQTNSDIRQLQQFLTSLGSSIYPAGKITGYFGPLTRQAVIRFQERYAQEILAPLHLKKGTGFVGSATLKKINALLSVRK
jgi:hypothetical protein